METSLFQGDKMTIFYKKYFIRNFQIITVTCVGHPLYLRFRDQELKVLRIFNYILYLKYIYKIHIYMFVCNIN